MNPDQASDMYNQLRGQSVGGWRICDLLGSGKSAVVFSAIRDECDVALKIFDPTLVNRFGRETQLVRINRELSLRDKSHDHLVRIYDGGACPETNFLYLVMQKVEGSNLSETISSLPRDQIRSIIRDISSAARFLETLGLAHRDIKPDNIVHSLKDGTSTLLDLGVLRPINASTASDTGTDFIGTLRYSSPEFLLREEEDTTEGWRAVTFYQLGCVLHDLIERKPIFINEVPYGKLVLAINQSTVSFSATDVPPQLIQLAINCLQKNPMLRLQLVTWEDFETASSASAFHQSTSRTNVELRHKKAVSESTPTWADGWNIDRRLQTYLVELQFMLRQWCVEQDAIPPVEMGDIAAPQIYTKSLLLRFRMGKSSNSNRQVQIRIDLSLLAPSTEAIEIRGSAHVANSDHCQTDADRTTRLYTGVELNKLAILEQFAYVVYTALDAEESASCGPIALNSPKELG